MQLEYSKGGKILLCHKCGAWLSEPMRIASNWYSEMSWKCENCGTINEKMILGCTHVRNIATDECPICDEYYQASGDKRTDVELI